MGAQILTVDYLKERLEYDQSSGLFYHKHDFGSRYKKGDRADTPGHARLSGYRLINLLNQKFLAHRVAWLYVHGVFPDLHVDHINGDKSDNRICNLRIVDLQKNIQNQRKPSKRSTTGVLGVHMHQGKFRAALTVDRKRIHIGMYETKEAAYAAYLDAKRRLHPGCTL